MGWYDSAVGGLEGFLGNAESSKQSLTDMVKEIARQEKAAAGGSWLGETWAGIKAGTKLAAINVAYSPGQALAGSVYVIAKEGPNVLDNAEIIYEAALSSQGRQQIGTIINDGVRGAIQKKVNEANEAISNGELIEYTMEAASGLIGAGELLKSADSLIARNLPDAVSKKVRATVDELRLPEAKLVGTKSSSDGVSMASGDPTVAPAAQLAAKGTAIQKPCQNCKATTPEASKGSPQRKAEPLPSPEIESLPEFARDWVIENPEMARPLGRIMELLQGGGSYKKMSDRVRRRELAKEYAELARIAPIRVEKDKAILVDRWYNHPTQPTKVIDGKEVSKAFEEVGFRSYSSTDSARMFEKLKAYPTNRNGTTQSFEEYVGKGRLSRGDRILANSFESKLTGTVLDIRNESITIRPPGDAGSRTPSLKRNQNVVVKTVLQKEMAGVLEALPSVPAAEYMTREVIASLQSTALLNHLKGYGKEAMKFALGEYRDSYLSDKFKPGGSGSDSGSGSSPIKPEPLRITIRPRGPSSSEE